MNTDFSWSHPVYEKVAKLVEAKTGLVLQSHRYADLEGGTREAMARMKIKDVGQYLRRLESERSCLDALTAKLTGGETYFFREPAQFQWVRDKLLPEIRGRLGKEQPLRAWSAGCSSGEEAYSLAILFEEEGLENHAPVKATDISYSALLKARKGLYSPWSLRGREDEWMDRYFKREPAGYRLAPRFLSRVEFEYLNLAADHYPDSAGSFWGMDLILCRNVMIYFSLKTVEDVFRKLIVSLSEGGWLVTSAADPLFEDHSHCEMIMTSAGVLYRKNSRADRHSISFPLEAWPAPWPFAGPVAPAQPLPAPPPSAVAFPIRAPRESVKIGAFPAASKAQEAFERMDYEQVLQLTQPHLQEAPACFLYLKALANLRGTAVAEQAAEKAVQVHPLVPELHFLRAVLLMNMGRDRDAAVNLRRVLYLDRTLAVAHFTLGSVLLRLQDREGAGRSYENALRLCRELPVEAVLPLSDGESAGQLREAAQTQLFLLLKNDQPMEGEK